MERFQLEHVALRRASLGKMPMISVGGITREYRSSEDKEANRGKVFRGSDVGEGATEPEDLSANA